MNNNFFTQLNQLLNENEQISITIKKNNDELTVSVLPYKNVKDEAVSKIKPILFTGKPNEFDTNFFIELAKPLEKTNEFLSNVKEHEDSLEKAKENSEIAKAEKEKQKKVREKSIKQLEKAQKYFDEKEYDKCKFICNQILKDDPKFSKATQLVKECDEKNIQPDIFSQASIDAPKEPVVEETQPLPNTEELRPTFDNTTIDDHSELPDVPRAEPCESIVTPVSESTYPDGTPKFQKEMENVDEEMRMQDENQDLPDSYDNEHLATGPKPKDSTNKGMSCQSISDEQVEIIKEENDLKYNNDIKYY